MRAALTYQEPRLLPDRDAHPVAPLTVLGDWRLPRLPRRGLGWAPGGTSLLVHAALLLLILLGLPDWMLRTPTPLPPPALEVELVVPPPPPPPPPPPKPVEAPKPPPPPPPPAPLASDASSQGPSPPKPAEKGEATPAAPAPGPAAAPDKSTPAPRPREAPKQPAAAPEQRRTPTPPQPRSTLAAPAPAPSSAAPNPAAEPQVAMSAPAAPRAPEARGEQPPAPASGRKPRSGFAMDVANPGGLDPALFDPYLAAIRDKIFAQRQRLRAYYTTGGGITVALLLDRAGRLTDMRVIQTTGSYALDNTVRDMIAFAAPFGPPPPALARDQLVLRFDLAFPSNPEAWARMMAGERE